MTTLRLLIVLFIATVFAQDKPAFEVASIRPSKLTIVGGRVRRDPSQLSIVNLTLKEMILYAWDAQPFQILGGPPWVDSDRFDVSAKPERVVQYHDAMLMMQSLLADRFQLTMHRETRELPIYTLVLARKDGRLGPGITPPTKENDRQRVLRNRGLLRAFGFSLSELAESLSETLGREVIDQTGLIGTFNINLEWTPNESQALQLPPGVQAPPPPENHVSIFTAIQEQLGLKLESKKGPVEVWVIDRAEKPSEN